MNFNSSWKSNSVFHFFIPLCECKWRRRFSFMLAKHLRNNAFHLKPHPQPTSLMILFVALVCSKIHSGSWMLLISIDSAAVQFCFVFFSTGLNSEHSKMTLQIIIIKVCMLLIFLMLSHMPYIFLNKHKRHHSSAILPTNRNCAMQ